MSYKEKPQLKLYKYENSAFILQAIIDDYQECSFEDNLYEAGQFSITINFNIPNSQLFQRGLFVRFGSSWKFGEITRIQDKIGEDGKGSQYRIITGFDARYILKRRVIKNMNSNGLWVMSGKGEIVLRNLINDQAGTNAENKRKLPIINTIPTSETAIGKEYSASEQFSNLYEVCKTIATQSEIGWRLEFNGTSLSLVCFEGTDRTQTVQFSTSFDSLANGEFIDSSESFSNAIYVGGKGQNDDRDIYEGESAIEGNSPAGLDRYESWDNQSSMTTESEYETEALSMLNQYGQTLTMSGNGLAKCPYEYEKEYFVGDKIKIAFSGKSANAQILSVTEHWVFGAYEINFSFGKPLPDLNAQLQLILKQIQKASNKTNSKDSVRWYTIPTDTQMPASDVTYNTIGFVGNVGSGATFTLYRDSSGTGSKTYHVYFKQLDGSGKLTLTTGVSGASNLVVNPGTYVAIIYVDENGNITSQGMTATGLIQTGNNQPVESGAVADEISNLTEIASSLPTDAVLHYSFDEVPDYPDGTTVYKKDNDFTDTTDWAGNATASVGNGKLTLTGTSGQYKYYTLNIPANNIIIVKGVGNVNGYVSLMVRHASAQADTRLIRKEIKQGEPFEIAVVVDANSTNFKFYDNSDWGITISAIYIGDGSYTTPIIDNTNGQNNATNNGGIATKGVSGKGVYFPSAIQSARIPTSELPAPKSDDDFTISLWLKLDSTYTNADSSGKPIISIGRFVGLFGLIRMGGDIIAVCRTSSKIRRLAYTVNKNTFYHVVMIYKMRKLFLFVNGEKIGETEPQDSNYQYGSGQTDWMIWSNNVVYSDVSHTTNQPATIDDLLIFDRALTENEVMALYQNKANTPKYYDLSDYKLKEVKENAQSQTLATPITIGGQSYTTVESALQALAGLV